MAEQLPKPVYRRDYTPSDYLIQTVDLRFELGAAQTDVHAKLGIIRNPAAHTAQPLVLDGVDLELLGLRLDGVTLSPARYQVGDGRLTLNDAPAAFTLETVTRIRPHANTSLEGLYLSNGILCTQCEAEGFRKITYFLDRPDVMATYTTTLIAERERFPVLLANGNLTASGDLDGGRHYATWHDPFKKPCYLFAVVAGQLACREDHYTTRSGRGVRLRIFVAPDHLDQCEHAMQSLKNAMAWDEAAFGLEYDLGDYMIVAVSDFNMGAMENKGLNVFNTAYVLAKPETATDDDYRHIEGVIGHEYFHNWTGNRVTCRDWFQLSLKEGLTLFRDQQFSASMGSRGIKRIDDVRLLRSVQFPQDAGPMAHPVRPDSYIEINNFYTATVYNKGAEVVRMLHTLVGEEGFRRGMDLYFQRHDGQAVTCEDFVAAMEDANGVDFQQFRRWYEQAGTPRVDASADYDTASTSFTLTLKQTCPPTPGQSHKEPFHIPVGIALLDADGCELPLQLEGENTPATDTTRVLELREREQQFRFVNIQSRPTPSLLRGFSAPVNLNITLSDDELMFLLAHDRDAFNRWEAGQQLATRTLLKLAEDYRQGRELTLAPAVCAAFGKALAAPNADPALLAQILTLPSESYLIEQIRDADVDAVASACQAMGRILAQALREDLLAVYHAQHESGAHRISADAMGRRSLKNRCLAYLTLLDDPASRALAMAQFRHATNMTDQIGALRALIDNDCPERGEALAAFYERWRHEPLVVDKWFTLQATSLLPDTLAQVRGLLTHPAFNIKNPNKVRALIGAFAQGNLVRFHAADGGGYTFVADQVLALNTINPQVAARLLGAFTRWRKFDRERQAAMRAQLQRISATLDLSPDVYEIAVKSLSDWPVLNLQP